MPLVDFHRICLRHEKSADTLYCRKITVNAIAIEYLNMYVCCTVTKSTVGYIENMKAAAALIV